MNEKEQAENIRLFFFWLLLNKKQIYGDQARDRKGFRGNI